MAEKVTTAEHWLEENPKIVFGVLGLVALTVAGFYGFRYWIGTQDKEAQKDMFQAVRYFETDSLNLALKAMETTSVSSRSSLVFDDRCRQPANFYAGAICLKQGKFQLAIFYFEDFKSEDAIVQAGLTA